MPTKLQRNKLDNFIRGTKLYKVIKKCIVNISNSFVGSQSRPLKWLGKAAPFGYFLANSRRAGITSVVSLFAILGFSLICIAPDTYAAASLSISVDSASESFDLLPTASSAAFGKSGIITASITTTNYTGYNFTITGPNASKTLVGTTSSSNTLESITSAITESAFSSSSDYDNKWGFLPSKLNGSTNSNYQPGPLNTTATVIDTTSAANDTANTYDFSLAARANINAAKDTYEGNFILTATVNPIAYKITYDGNGATTNVPSAQTGDFSGGTTIAISSTTPTMTNYTFAGWCTSTVSNYSTCNGATIASGGTYTFSNPSDTVLNEITLTAIWQLNYSVSYNANGGSGAPSTQSGSVNYNSSFSLSSTTPTRTNYTFNGWCTGTVTNYSTCSGTTYDKSASITITSPTTLSLTAIWKLNYSVSYNASTGGSGAPSAESGSVNYNGTFTLSSTTPTRSGYDFNGWCTVDPSGGEGCSGTAYSKGQTITVTSPVTLTLYARWKAPVTINQAFANAGKSTSSGYYKMQDMTTAICSAVTDTTGTATLIDTRDSNTYTVGKLADGKCWLLENLRLVGSKTLTSSDSNVSSNFTLPASGTVCFNSGSCTGTNGTTGTGYTVPAINSTYINTSDSYGKYGVYYNYCAASAGTYCYDSSEGTGNASYDICPKGWRMPTGKTGEYQALYTAITGSTCTIKCNDTTFRTALKLPLSGNFYGSTVYNQGSGGNFWSSTYYNGSVMYDLWSGSTSVNPQNYNYRNNGESVRCVAQ